MRKVTIIILVVILFYFMSCSMIISSFDSESIPQGNVAVIPIKGTISLDSSGINGFDQNFVVRSLKEANERKDIKAIVIEINSPGGAPVATDEIGRLVKDSQKPTVAWIREMGASGGYWIASNADYIIANRMSITGSIGVIGSYLEFSEFLDRYNVTYQRVVSGEYKDIGSPFKKLTLDEESALQAKINLIHEYFVQEVAENRELSIEEVETIASGMIFLGSEAKDLGLVDELGGEQEVKNYLEKVLGQKVNFAYYNDETSIIDLLSLKTRNPISIPEGITLQ